MNYKKHIAEQIKIEGLTPNDIEREIVTPPNTEMGDYALPCFKFSKALRMSPVMIAEKLKGEIKLDEYISEVNSLSGYLNFKINRDEYARAVIDEILSEGDSYGSSKIGGGRTVCIDYSSINIGKPFHIGHLSTTVIGAALYRIFNFLGYKAVGINHLGDYGTQFGKLVSAYKRYGDKETIEKGGIRELVKIYVKFHEEAEKDETLNDEARHYFKLIEEGDKATLEIYEWFKQISLKEVGKVYDLLGIKFDSYAGESFYNDKMGVVIDELKSKNLLVESDGAQIVDLSAYDMPPCIILRSDGASLYHTRDLAAAYYRKKTYDFDKCLYVVAYQQNLHFQQLFKVLELLGKPWAKDCVHVQFGMVSLPEGTMSTRHGKVTYLIDVLNKSIEKAANVIEEKSGDLPDKENVAKMIGVGAVVFGALKNNRIKDIVFDMDKALSFDGETAPYLQYTSARCNSVLVKGGAIGEYKIGELNTSEYDLVSKLDEFTSVVTSAAEKYEPSLITRYALDVASLYNKFYFDNKIIGSEQNVMNYRLALTKATLTTLKNALTLLGIGVPERM